MLILSLSMWSTAAAGKKKEPGAKKARPQPPELLASHLLVGLEPEHDQLERDADDDKNKPLSETVDDLWDVKRPWNVCTSQVHVYLLTLRELGCPDRLVHVHHHNQASAWPHA